MKPERSPWPAVALLSLTATAGYICRVNISTAGALVMEEFGLTQAQMGRIFSAFLLGYALFQVPGGALADRWGAGRVLMAASFAWAALTSLPVLVGRELPASDAGVAIAVLMASRFLLGVAAAPTYPAAARGVASWVRPGQQGRANGMVIASVGLGSAIAPPLVSAVMVEWGWRASLLVSAAPALVMALLWLRAARPAPAVGEPEPEARERAAAVGTPEGRMRSPSFVLLTASYTLQGYVGYIFVFWFYLYLVQERRFDLLRGAWISSLPWVLSIASIPFGGWLSDRLTAGRLGPVWGRRAVPLAGMALSGVLISFGARTGSPYMAAAALALATAFVMCVEGPFWAAMMGLAGRRSGTAGGIMNMGCNIGGLISPALTPLLAQYLGWQGALHLAAGLAVLAAALWLGIRPAAPEGDSVTQPSQL